MIATVGKISQFSKKEIDYAFEHAARLVKTRSIVILCSPAQRSHGRILVIASRKVGKAVGRNKFKRRLKNIFYQEKMYECDYDFICIAKAGALELSFESLQKLLVDAKSQCLNLSL